MPRIVWDNPQPLLKEDNVGESTEGKYQLLLFLSRALVGSERAEDLVRWAEEVLSPLVPVVSNLGPVPTTNEAPLTMAEMS